MSEPILSTDYWRRRLEAAQAAGVLHHSVFRCPLERWQRIEARHRDILARLIGPTDSVLDAGCGYGRLLDLMPPSWGGCYLGVDLSPDLIREAQFRWAGYQNHEMALFYQGDLRDLSPIVDVSLARFAWAILISVRPMVIRNCGEEVWQQMEAELRRVAKKLLYLEYDPDDEGSIE